MANAITVEEIKEILKPIMYPGMKFSLIELGVIQDIAVNENKAVVTIALPFSDTPHADTILGSVKKQLENKGIETEITTTVMNKDQVQNFIVTGREDWFSLG